MSLWRAALVYRVLAGAFCVGLIVRHHSSYRHPPLGLVVAAVIVGWTAVVGFAAARRWMGDRWFVVTDVVVVAVLTLATIPVETTAQAHGGTATLTTVWAAGPALGAGIRFGWRGGLVAAVLQGVLSMIVRAGWDANTVANSVLLVLAGVTVGYVSQLLVRAERELAAAAAARAAVAERDRLARGIHDGVLQVLALVQRRGVELGGEAATLGRLAGEQEAALRSLITSAAHEASSDGDDLDIAARLVALGSTSVTVSVPAQPVGMARSRGEELVAAVEAALDNVRRHAGADARAWVLLEDLGSDVGVSVRDDGVGVAAGRFAEAADEGRLGVRASIRGRAEALGGQASITSSPGAGTEVEIRVPR